MIVITWQVGQKQAKLTKNQLIKIGKVRRKKEKLNNLVFQVIAVEFYGILKNINFVENLRKAPSLTRFGL